MNSSEKSVHKFYKFCIVPGCKNTSILTPEKLFIYVPKDTKKRKIWIKACRRKLNSISETSTVYCCEDHFNLEEDMENWCRFKMMGGPIRMKADVVPHIFDRQPDRKLAKSTPLRAAAAKRHRANLIAEAIDANKEDDAIVEDATQDDCHEPESSSVNAYSTCIGIQVNPNFRSKTTQTRWRVSNAATSPEKITFSNSMTSPFKSVHKRKFSDSCTDSSSCDEKEISVTDGCSDVENSSDEFDEDLLNEIGSIERKEVAVKRVDIIINRNPRLYLGLPENCSYVLDMLQRKTNLKMKVIMLTLKKIRLNECFTILSDDFGISPSTASRMFCTAVPKIANSMKQLILWPEKSRILTLLPIPFRARYGDVQSIIDCLEIEIEKPSDPVKQALTWSEYKSANTLKYLISNTPVGLINYISVGYGGRISDSLLVEKCGFLERLPPGCAVLADRGFKHIENLLGNKGCTLVRPPSVKSGVICTKKEVMETKKIASLRIHVERAIRRVREFKMLLPHACVDHNLISLIDDVIIIAGGLINLQTPLIK